MISKGCKSIFPIQHQEIWDRYKQHVQAFWTPEEVSLQDDLRDLKTLNEGEKHFIKHVLAFFANSEAMINENLASRFYNEILIPESRLFITMQMLNESIHAEMYGLQIEAYVEDPAEKDKTVPGQRAGDNAGRKVSSRENTSMPGLWNLFFLSLVHSRAVFYLCPSQLITY